MCDRASDRASREFHRRVVSVHNKRSVLQQASSSRTRQRCELIGEEWHGYKCSYTKATFKGGCVCFLGARARVLPGALKVCAERVIRRWYRASRGFHRRFWVSPFRSGVHGTVHRRFWVNPFHKMTLHIILSTMLPWCGGYLFYRMQSYSTKFCCKV